MSREHCRDDSVNARRGENRAVLKNPERERDRESERVCVSV